MKAKISSSEASLRLAGTSVGASASPASRSNALCRTAMTLVRAASSCSASASSTSSRRACSASSGGGGFGAERLVDELGQAGHRRIVEGQRGRQPQAGCDVQPVAQFHHGERVEAELGERPVHRHGVAVAVREHPGHLVADQVQHQLPAGQLVELAEAAAQVAARFGRPGAGPARCPGQAAQHRRELPGLGPLAQAGAVPGGPGEHRRGLNRRGRFRARTEPARHWTEHLVEQRQAVLAVQRRHAGPGQPGQVGLAELARHPGSHVPQAPGHRRGRQAQLPPVCGQPVEEAVGRRVAALPGVADQAGE